ncbi:hypothetical protein C0585_04330 [Candidatus Woesearchaeota archaeon]|nr:MAG: hypothetical protein C0585_04330 [Candidatus Woesearchaeota archaeon]
MKIYDKLADVQYKYPGRIIIFTILFTLLMLVGVSKIYMESDITNEFPQDLEVFKIQDEINNLYGVGDSVLVTLRLDPDYNAKDRIYDIRDPYVIQSIMLLESVLNDNSAVDSVSSVAQFFYDQPYIISLEQTKGIIQAKPASQTFFNKDYTSTLMVISASIGTDQQKIRKMIDELEDNKEETFIPPGVDVTVTGTPFITNLILTLMQKDAIFTTSLAAFIILLLLITLQRSLTKGLLIFIPLTLGLTWTLGTLGWLDIPISVATVGVGAMILGLGVEYGVFVVSRYNEERLNHKSSEALNITVNEVGGSISGSGMTTIVGFMALTFSIMPMMQHLGQSLALGIFYSLLAALVVNPALIVFEENFERKNLARWEKSLHKRRMKIGSKK